MVEMVQVTSWYDCTSKQSRYVQLSVREVSEKSADRNFAFDTPVFCNHDLFFIVLICLIALLFLTIYVVQKCYFKWSVCERHMMCNLYSSFWDYRQFYTDTHRVCIGKRRLSDSALLCRRAGSKRIKNGLLV